VPDPTNPADVPASWLPQATHPKPPAYTAAVARKVHNRHWAKVVDMAEEVTALALREPWILDLLDTLPPSWWVQVVASTGRPLGAPPKPETVAEVIAKVRADVALERERNK